MDRNDALRRIQKCMGMSKSSEPHEAARALAQAQKLMAQFDIEHPELLAAGVAEGMAKSRATKSPPAYEMMLANAVCESFGCKLVFAGGAAAYRIDGMYRFIGVGAAGEVAGYTFSVLARKLTAARTEYTAAKLARYRKNKVAAADEFCVGWVRAVARAVPAALANDDHAASVAAYMEQRYPSLGTVSGRKRELANVNQALDHRLNGFLEGKKAHVSTAIAGAQPTQLALGV